MRLTTSAAALLLVALMSINSVSQSDRVSIRVDATRIKGEMKPVWSFFGYDEPNYTYMKDGKKLLSELAALSPAPVFVRTHNLPDDWLVMASGTQVGFDQCLH
jgi:xylan 1,4-beta-xylosidase